MTENISGERHDGVAEPAPMCPRCLAAGRIHLVPLLDIWVLPPVLMQCSACGFVWVDGQSSWNCGGIGARAH